MRPAVARPDQIYKQKIHEQRRRQTPGSTILNSEMAHQIGGSQNNKKWISPLQKIAQKFNELDLSKIEKIGGYARDPSTSPAKVDSKEKAG